uniref:NADH-ubiquinone oxidoreductase chain 3 n=1 Tax=Nacolus tuberculatus TaxID=2800230 RepID=A0A7T6YDN7_9HEMI|nr:NADH dehydrogenase subunit 3 [Nacolus tuberculatus]QQK57726.1 NADH dehydrogenase subunit 3 [Nacolus tuberculatus]
MYLIMKYTIIITMIMLTMTLLIMMMSKKQIKDLQKLSPFECGFNPLSMKRMPFSIHFFLIAVIFLIFDVEVIIIMPSLFSMKYSIMINWLVSSTLFMLILILGTLHEWKNGMLNWTK